MKEIIAFLSDLEQNNTREWFEANKPRYDTTRKEFLKLIEYLIHEIRTFDDEIPPLNPKDCVFRIFRDVRFSNDKRPYKTNYGGYIARGGRKSGYSGYYFHLEPSECFLSGGIYMPSPEFLQAIRQEIYYHPQKYIDLVEDPVFKSTFKMEYLDPLKTAPKGYPRDWEHINYLKNRNYAYGSQVTLKEMEDPDFLKKAVETYKIIYPFNRFLNKAVDENLSTPVK